MIPIPIVLDEDDGVIDAVQASYADFIWGMPAATDPIYPIARSVDPQCR